MNLMNKLTTYASLVGVICTIGGGFYAWGEFNTRIGVLEKKKMVSMSPITKRVDVLSNSVSAMQVELIDRIDALREKVEAGSEVDLSVLAEQIDSVEEAITSDLDAMKDTLTKIDKEVSIVKKENELQDEKIEAVRLKATNPLAS